MTDFEAILRALVGGEVEFILVGGVAAAAHGSSRLTQDVDVVYRRTSANISRLVKALSPYQPSLRDAPPGLPFRLDKETIQRGLNFTLATKLGALDLFGEIAGGGKYEDLLPDTVALTVFGLPCRCLKLRRLIEVKRAAGRPRDLEAIAELEALLEQEKGRGLR